jgi:hypothetical protein
MSDEGEDEGDGEAVAATGLDSASPLPLLVVARGCAMLVCC